VRGEAVLGRGLAQDLGLGEGDTITLDTSEGARPLRVAATVTEYSGGGRVLYLEWGTARRLLKFSGAHAFMVTARPGEAGALGVALREFCDRRALLLQSNDEFRRFLDGLLARVVAALWGLMALAFAVASLGVVNTLTMNVHEQTGELAVLRSLGMRRRQVCGVILRQALLTGLCSLLPGALVGVGVAYLMNAATNALLGQQVSFRVDGVLVAGCCALGLGVALLASLLPVARASRVDLNRALRRE
jgi:ABC-type lipoprotein release transport system permease subunit